MKFPRAPPANCSASGWHKSWGWGDGSGPAIDIKQPAIPRQRRDFFNLHSLARALATTSRATGAPFNWRDLTPVQMLALDQFVLWVNEETPHNTAKTYFEAIRAQSANTFKMGGGG